MSEPELAQTSTPAEGYGVLVVYYDECGRITVERADPLIRISGDLLEQIRAADAPIASLDGDVLTWFPSSGPRVVYRIDWTDFEVASNSYRAEWPD